MKKYLVFIIVIIYISACNSFTYMPTEHQVMPFEQKGDAIVGITTGFRENIGIKGGYSFTDNIGIVSNLNTFDLSNNENSDNFLNDYTWDNELVLYKKFNPIFYMGVNAGAGWGKLNSTSQYYCINTNKQYILPWVNGVFQVDSNHNIYGFLGFSVKLLRTNYSIKQIMNTNSEYDQMMFDEYFNFSNFNPSKFKGELGLTGGYNFDFVKIQLQSVFLLIPKYETNVIPMNGQVSLIFNLTRLMNKKNKF